MSSLLQVAIDLGFWSPIILFSIGIPAALFNIIIFIRVNTFRQSASAYYIVGQSLSDIASLSMILIQSIPGVTSAVSSASCKSIVFFSQVAGSCTLTLRCLAAFDRWACTSRSARIRTWSSIHIARYLCSFSVLFWSILSTPCLIFCDLIPPMFTCGFTNELVGQLVTILIAPILAVFLPLIFFILFVIFTWRNIQFITQNNNTQTRLSTWEQQITRLMVVQTLINIICTLPRAVLVLYVAFTVKNRLTRSIDAIIIEYFFDQLTLFLFGINNISTFYLFLGSSHRFRQTIRMILKSFPRVEDPQVHPM